MLFLARCPTFDVRGNPEEVQVAEAEDEEDDGGKKGREERRGGGEGRGETLR